MTANDPNERLHPTEPTTVPDAHFPPLSDVPVNWNPITNTWEPIPPLAEYDVAEPGHEDIPTATPLSDTAGHEDSDGGSTPDRRMNLLDAVRGGVDPDVPLDNVVHHVMETREAPVSICSGRIVAVVGNAQPSVLLSENPNRTRALIKVITSASVIMVGAEGQGGNVPLVAAPTIPAGQYPQATGDPVLTIESTGAVEAYGTVAAPGVILVAVWEEQTDPTSWR